MVDERVLNKYPKDGGNLNIFKKAENLILGLNSALALGCKIVNIRQEDIAAGVPHLILGLLWQVDRNCIFYFSTLAIANSDLYVLIK